MHPRRWLFLAAAVFISSAAQGDVIEDQRGGFRLKTTLAVAAPPETVWKDLVNIGAWWDATHTYSGDARNLSIDLRPGGCFSEKLPDGGGVCHLVVVMVKPGKMLRLSGGLGPLQAEGRSGALTWQLSPSKQGTALEVTYNVSGEKLAETYVQAAQVDNMLHEQASRLKAFAERK
jgi:uncharacterized protein YndB with AHSA1/START domain